MTKKSLLASLIAVLAFVGWEALVIHAPMAHAEVTVLNGAASPSPGSGIAVTSTAATTAFTTRRSSVSIFNCGATCLTPATTGQIVYARVFWCGETVTAATATTGIPIAPGATVGLTFNANTEQPPSSSFGYCNVSLVTATSTGAVTVITK